MGCRPVGLKTLGGANPSSPTMTVKYTAEILSSVVKESYSISEVLRKLGCKGRGTTHAHVKSRIIHYNLDTSHFTGLSSDRNFNAGAVKLEPKQILTHDRNRGRREHPHVLRRALIESGVEQICNMCGIPSEWRGSFLQLEIDHIDGDRLNNVRDNLRFLCPNCHSQTETFSFKSSRPIFGPKTHGRLGRPKLSDEAKMSLRTVDYDAVKLRYAEIKKYETVGKEFGVCGNTVKRIVNDM